MKKEILFSDQRILDEFCNSRCKYCGGYFPSDYSCSIKDGRRTLVVPESWKKKIQGSKYLSENMTLEPEIGDFFTLGRKVIDEVDEIFDYKILKLSGGEIFLNNNMVDFVRSIHKKYSAVQLLTNAMALLPQQINELAKLGNICFQISLDGTSAKTNQSRIGNPKVLKKILDNIECISRSGIGLEINCVLTKFNTAFFKEMLEYFKNYDNLIIAPRPVRGEPRTILDFSQEDVEVFEEIVIGQYDKYSKILPAKAYLKRLVELMKNGHRNWKCYAPFYIIGVDNYGDISTCTTSTELPYLGNVLENAGAVKRTIDSGGYNPHAKYKSCEYCLIQYEILNLYTEGSVTKDELKRIPSLKFPGIIERIDSIKSNILAEAAKN